MIRKTVNSGMVLLARESRGFTQQELAGIVDTSKAQLSRIENGDADISDGLLAAIADATGYPPSFFYQDGELLPLNLAFRKRLKVPAKVIAAIEAQVNIMRLQMETLITTMEIATPVLPVIDVTDKMRPAEIALKVRQAWKIKTPVIEDLVQLLEEKGILINSFDFGTTRVDSNIILTRSKFPLIFLNATLQGDRQRFSLAYELGQLVMHSYCKVPYDRDIVHEANEFAASFLMPESLIRKDLERGITLPLLGDLKRKWKVSMISLLYRADDLGLLTPNQKKYMVQQFNEKRIRRREPAELDVPAEEPQLVRQLLKKCSSRFDLPLQGMAALLCMQESEYMELYEEPTNMKSILK